MKKKTVIIAVAGCFVGIVLSVIVGFGIDRIANDYYYDADYSYNGGMSSTSSITQGFGSSSKGDVMLDMAASSSMNTSESMTPVVPDTPVEGDTAVLTSGRKLIRRAQVEAETKEYEEYTGWLDRQVVSLGAYYESKETSVNNRGYEGHEYRTLYATVRVPTVNLDAFLNSIQDQGNVLYRNETQSDITDSYTDVDAHLNSMRVEQQRLDELMSVAETVEDILSIEDRLSWVRYEIESYERQLRSYDNQIDYSVVTLQVREVLAYTEAAPEGFFDRCWSAFKNNLEWLGRFLQGTAIFLFGHIPVIVVGSIVGVLVYKFRKKRTSRKSVNLSKTE